LLLTRLEEPFSAGAVCVFRLGHADLTRGATQSSRLHCSVAIREGRRGRKLVAVTGSRLTSVTHKSVR
jgi:hypothetical protein